MKLRILKTILKNNQTKNAKGPGLRLKPIRVEFTHQTASTKPAVKRIRIYRVRFEFIHPTASCVYVAGTFNDWEPEATLMIPLGNGRWQKDMGLPPSTHEYCFVADGIWMTDPLVKETVPNPFGGINSVLKVGQRV